MYIEQLYTSCLAEAAYYIESGGQAAIIDPLRDPQPYVELAKSRRAEIKYIFETHFHADFVSGHIDLARETNAQIIYGPTASAAYDIVVAEDDEIFPLGDIQIKVLHTPGHTMESSCFLVLDEEGKEHSVFTGDTLFIGDVGRPDLAIKTDLSREDLARHLFRSIQSKLMPLHDETVVFPGHGAGSQCGKNLSNERSSTIGNQKRYNYALQEDSEEGFVKAVTSGLTAPPQYFPKNAVINKMGYERFDDILERSLNPMDVMDFVSAMTEEGTVVVDTRDPGPYSLKHIPGSYFFGLNGSFAVWVGTIIRDLNTPILLVADPDKEKEAITRLARVGYCNVVGYLEGGFANWVEADFQISSLDNICPVDFRKNESPKSILDVRTANEFESGHVESAVNIPLSELVDYEGLNPDARYYIYCRSGYRSMIACAILKRQGFSNLINLKKGYQGYSDPSKTCCCVAATKFANNGTR